MTDLNEPDPDPGVSVGGSGGEGGDAGGGGGGTAWRLPERSWWVPFLVGAVMLLGYGLFLSYMKDQIKAPEPDWSRLVYLFSGVEALAFGAAGFFFGREVNRSRVEAAESRAVSESRRAAGAERRAANATARGQVLSAALRELADGAAESRTLVADRLPLREAPARDPRSLHQLARLADRWFPRGW